MNQFDRLFELERRIRTEQYPSAASLAVELGVTERLIYRDRNKLVQMGAPIKWHSKRGGWYYSDPHFQLPTAMLSEGELLAFFLSVEIARSSGNAGLQDGLQKAVAKIAKSLGEIVSVDLNALRDSTSYSLSPAARVDAQFYLDLHRAGAGREKVGMRYFTASRGEWNERVVHPYHLHFVRGEWILIAFDENKEAIRCFNIARISRLNALNEHFERQSDFDAAGYVRNMLFAEAGEEVFQVVVHFDEYQARYIREREGHPDQKLEERPDGSAILRFPASGLNEAARWVMGFGKHAMVLEPPQLIELIRSHLQHLTQLYEVEPAFES